MIEPVFELPFDGTLDLHTFAPSDVKSLIPDYIDECVKRGINQIRIIHGKGTGTLRRIVHAALDCHPAVASYRHEGGSGGSWGATVVDLWKEESDSGGGA
jgi:dsDNA-specific endonuclease/ATPase MutS2